MNVTSESTTQSTDPVVDWHTSTNGNQAGPFSEAEIHDLIDQGLSRESFVWNKNLPDWLPILNSDFSARFSNPPPLPTSITKQTSTTPKKSAISGTSIVILILAAFGGILGKNCGQSATGNKRFANSSPNSTNLESRSTPSPPLKEELKEYNVAGLSILLPNSPSTATIDLPPEALNLVRSFNSYNVKTRSMEISINHAIYTNPNVSLDQSADGSIDGVRKLPTVRSLSSSKRKVSISGLDGRETTMNYMNSKFNIDQFSLVFDRGLERWQIQIIGEGSQNREALENLKNAIFESIRLLPDG